MDIPHFLEWILGNHKICLQHSMALVRIELDTSITKV